MSDLNLAQVWLKFKSQVAVEELLTVYNSTVPVSETLLEIFLYGKLLV